MTAYATLPSDIYRPEVLREIVGFEFFDSLQLLDKAMGPEGSGAPIRLIGLETMFNQGRAAYVQQPVFSQIDSLIQDTDLTSFASIDTAKLTARNDIGVLKVIRTKPVSMVWSAGKLTVASFETWYREFVRQSMRQYMQKIQHSVISALYGIIGGVTASAHTKDVWAAASKTPISPTLFSQALQMMGEFDSRITHWLMRSQAQADLRDDSIQRAFPGIADVTLKSGEFPTTLGRSYSVVDDSNLVVSDAGFYKYRTLGIGPGILDVEFTNPIEFAPPFVYNDREQLQIVVRGDAIFTLIPHGTQWDTTNGGANPSDSALATTTNWDPTYSDAKEIHGVAIVHNWSQSVAGSN